MAHASLYGDRRAGRVIDHAEIITDSREPAKLIEVHLLQEAWTPHVDRVHIRSAAAVEDLHHADHTADPLSLEHVSPEERVCRDTRPHSATTTDTIRSGAVSVGASPSAK